MDYAQYGEKQTEAQLYVEQQVMMVNELMPLRNPQNDNMERIADMTEEFSQLMDPILRMYSAAMSATTARLEIIKDEFKYRKCRCPIHHIDTRLKSAKSILGKLQKKDLDLTLSAACNNVYDIAGIRVVCPYIKDVYLIRDRIMAQDDIQIMEIKDYIEKPKNNGYRSLHLIVEVPIFLENEKRWMKVEVQLRTIAMEFWANLEHKLRYKKNLSEDLSALTASELSECAEMSAQLDLKMQNIRNIIYGNS